MYIEGKCLAVNLWENIANDIMKVKKDDGTPMWEMISSNIGVRKHPVDTYNDDGWVFRSKGLNGKQNLIINIRNGLYHTSAAYHWLWGNCIGVASDYIPGNAGENGQFKNAIYETASVFQAYAWGDITENSLAIKYYLSVTEERIIVALKSDINHSYSKTNLIFMGRPHIMTTDEDHGIILATGISYEHNGTGSMRLLNPTGVRDYSVVTLYPRAVLSSKAMGWGGKIYPSNISLQLNSSARGGIYGILDILVLPEDGSVKPFDTLRIGDIEYLVVQMPHYANIYNNSNCYNNFSPNSTAQTFNYLMPKI